MVSDYILMTLFLKFLNHAKLLCHFCPPLTSPSKIGQTVEQPKQCQKNLVPDHHGHPAWALMNGSYLTPVIPKQSVLSLSLSLTWRCSMSSSQPSRMRNRRCIRRMLYAMTVMMRSPSRMYRSHIRRVRLNGI